MEVGKVVEFFSGIGGWSFAFRCLSGREGTLSVPDHVTAVEININGNEVLRQNFPDHTVLCKDIRYLRAEQLANIQANTWVMSPPCQPYTTLGKQLGAKDNRAGALHHLCNALLEMPLERGPNFICMENVPGFYQSESHYIWTETLKKCGYYYFEFLLSPTQFGIPNERLRYFCTARKIPWNIQKESCGILRMIPQNEKMFPHAANNNDELFAIDMDYIEANVEFSDRYYSHCRPISEFLELENWETNKQIPDGFASRCKGYKHDLVSPLCKRSSCFTSGYSISAKGAGSLVFESPDEFSKENQALLPQISPEIINEGNIRFFTPREVANLMGFPADFRLPDTLSTKAMYKLLGNSINVECASHVLRFLFLSPEST